MMRLFCLLLLSMHIIKCVDNAQDPPNIQETLQELCNVPLKAEDYFTQLIDKKEAIQSIADEDIRKKYTQELNKAETVLSDENKRNLYNILGHKVYTDLLARNQLLPDTDIITLFQNYMLTNDLEPLRKAIELYGMLVKEVPLPNALNNLIPTRDRTQEEEKEYQKLRENEKKVADIFGPELFKQIPKKELTTWAKQVEKESNQALLLKNMLNLVLCRYEQAQEKKEQPLVTEQQQQKQVKRSKQESSKELDKTPAKPMVKGKAHENIAKANTKLQSALRSLRNAKRYFKGIDRQERENIKIRINHILQDNAAGTVHKMDEIKKLGSNVLPSLREFTQTIQQIITEIKSI